tara:strand:- start:116 stop:2515 length:2400 start_codon:yes stop_codon:yes gene_type:complete
MISIKKFFVLLAIFILFLSIYNSKNLRLDASSDTLILKNDKTFEYFQYYNEIFPSRNFLVLAIKAKKQIDEEYIDGLNKVVKEINKITNVDSVFSILNAPILLLNNLSLIDLSQGETENINNSKYKLDSILDEFSNSPLFKDQIINSNKDLSSIIIYTKKNYEYEKIKNKRNELLKKNKDIINIDYLYRIEKEKNLNQKELLIKNVRNIINNQNNNYEYYLGGIDMIANDTISYVKNDVIIFSFAVILFIIIVLLFIYKDIKWVLIPLITSIYSVIVMIGFIGYMNLEITAISSNFISLMLILSISMNIHIINHYKINYHNSEITKKIENTFKKMFWPCFYTGLTTIIAFGSLLFSNIKPIIDFGNIMILSLIIIFLCSFSILPLIIYYFPKINKSKKFKFSILKNFYEISIKNYNKILLLNFLLFSISIFGIYNLNVENSFINYFKSNTEIYKGMKLIDTQLGGTTPLDILIKFKDNQINIKPNTNDSIDDDLWLVEDFDIGDDFFIDDNIDNVWFNNDKIRIIKDIHNYLESRKEIGKVQSLNSLIDMANQINKKDLTIFELSVLYNEIPDEYKSVLIDPYLSTENNMIKISARIKDSDDIKRNNLINDISIYINNKFQNDVDFKINGLLVLYNNMLQSLFSSQIKSFGIILISIFVMFLILFKSLRLSIIGIIPNIIASTFILGLIGLLKIPLDIMTITIAAITIGIAVDNTIHYIYRIKENEKTIVSSEKLIEDTHNNVGNAVLTTSLTIAFGFSVLCLSNFIPTILFGLFTALAMIIAMIGVLITLPALMIRFK